ncbi:MAG: hypothetical protein DI533_07180 [Cereibacter sphaeroides]|uniref:Uncharacterized protein n=1 Tax=Cereibacter sphaeroides TaxID=1063 RepID=A0A2W5URD7_CERSP|nr:MAG: hypothetical protein DI533_07180 [Cereibacter sphaeroides]
MRGGRQDDVKKLYSGSGNLAQTIDQMGPVAARLVAGSHLRDRLPGGIAAGYTFLAQLLAHEVSAVTPEVSVDLRLTAPVQDRARGLMLDSIFGPISETASEPAFFTFRASASDPGRPVSVDVPWDDNDLAVVHDTRNADTPILSQLSALFIAYCVRARRILRASYTEAEAAVLSRLLTAEVFHAILRGDLLPHILHPDVWALYGGADWQVIDAEGRRPGALIPVEFSNAAFRFGHAMVRSNYTLNDRSPSLSLGELTRGIRGLNARRAANSNFWRVDWRLFFGTGSKVQLGRRIGPGVPPDLEKVTVFLKSSGQFPVAAGKNDIALRDLLRGAGAGLQRVSACADAMVPFLRAQPELARWALWDKAARGTMMRDWLSAEPDLLPDHLIGDPPPYLYILIESGAKGSAGGCGEGRTLGALGSVLAAEVVLPPLRQAEIAVATQPGIAEARRMVLGRRQLPRTMTKFIQFLT